MSQTIHCSLEISGALRRPGFWRKALEINGCTLSADEFRDWLLAEARTGREAIPLGCPSPLPNGRCPGHDTEENDG